MKKSPEQLIHEATMRVLARDGIFFELPEAVEILKENGINVDENGIARFTEEEIMFWVRKAPHEFKLYGRNPEHDIIVVGTHFNPAPGYGCPFVIDDKGNQILAKTTDFVKIAKMYQQQKKFHVNGGILVQPDDLPIDNAALIMMYLTYFYSDKVMLTSTADRDQVKAMMELAKVAFGGEEELKKYPRLITLINTVTPLQLTNVMTESLIEFVKNGQPVVVGSLGLCGATSPMTIEGSLVVSNAEILAGIALCEMINPGAPVIYGCETTTSDMRSIATAIGAPEGAIIYNQTGKMADFYGIPSRAGGTLTDAKTVDAQAGFESMFTYKATRDSNVNFMIHAAGIVDAYASVSYEKMILDFEIMDYVDRYYDGIELNPDNLAEEAIHEVGQFGSYLTCDHTYYHFKDASMVPSIAIRGTEKEPEGALMRNMQEKVQKMLDDYKRPELDEGILEKMRDVLRARGVEDELIKQMESM